MTIYPGTDRTLRSQYSPFVFVALVSQNSPHDFVASTSERVPLTRNISLYPTVTWKADSGVIVVAKPPSPGVSLCTCIRSPHIHRYGDTNCARRCVMKGALPARRSHCRTVQSLCSANLIRLWVLNTTDHSGATSVNCNSYSGIHARI